MAKQSIDIGVQGNDGTGDSIRESFRKVNENFNEIYAVFGVDGTINFTDLSDAPEIYVSNQIIMSNNAGDALTARTIVTEGAISVDTDNDGEIVLSVGARGVQDDTSPRLANYLNANNLQIVRLANPSQSIVDNWNLTAGTQQTTLDQLAVTVGYADDNYLRVSGENVESVLKVREEPAFPDFSSEDYDPSLVGNYLSTEAVQRKFVVSRKGDTMTGPLQLHDHPSPLEGYGTPNGSGDLQAATKFYVDNQVFSSAVNLFVSTSTGDDLQQKTPVGKEGRFWQYAYKTIGAATLAAENLIALASQEPGPYRQRLSYTEGPDQFFSTITNVTLIDGNTAVNGYPDAFQLLQLNRNFLQSEGIAYINLKYVNTFTYDKAKYQADLSAIITSVANDIVLDTTFNSTRAATSYYDGTEGEALGQQLIQLIEAIKFARDDILNFSYDNAALSTYIGQVVDALAYDLLFQTNHRSIQAGLHFEFAGTDVNESQITQVLIDLKDKIIDLVSVETIPAAKTSIETNVLNIIDIINGNEYDTIVWTDQPNTIIGQKSARDLLFNNILFIQAETIGFLGAEYPNLAYSRDEYRRDIEYITWAIIYDIMYGGNSQSVYTGLTYWNNTVRQIEEYEVAPFIDLLDYIKTLMKDIVRSDSPVTVYQQSVNQYRNETFINGDIAVAIIDEMMGYIQDIIQDYEDAPTIVEASPSANGSAAVLQTARTNILLSKSNYQSEAVTFIETEFPVINDPAILSDISAKFQIIIDLLTFGIESRVNPEYNEPAGTNDGYVDAKDLILLNHDFIADVTTGWLDVNRPSYDYDEALLKQQIKDVAEAAIYDLIYGGNSASIYKGQQLFDDVNNDQNFLDAIEFAGDLIRNYIISNVTFPLGSPPLSSLAQFRDGVTYPNGSVAGATIGLAFSTIGLIASGEEGPSPLNPLLVGYDIDYQRTRQIMILNAESISIRTTDFLDANYRGGFNYNEATCYRDIGLIIDAMSIDLITDGTYQSINAGKSYYRNASARAVAIGTQLTETLDAIQFVKTLALQVLNQTTASRFQLLETQVFDISLNASAQSKIDLSNNMDTLISIIVDGVGIAPAPTFGTGIWNVSIDNGGNGYVDQGAPGNNDIIPAKVLVGLGSEAYGVIVKYTPGTTSSTDTIQLRLTKPGFFVVGEEIEFGETVKDINIVIQVESGIYYEDYPIRLPSNVSVRGDEFRRTIVRPRDRISQSPWRKVFFYRDSIIDALELGPIDYNTDYAIDTTVSLGGTTAEFVATLGSGQVPGSWVGKILMDDFTGVEATSTTALTGVVTTDVEHNFQVGNPIVFRDAIGGLESGRIYYVLTVESVNDFTLTNKKNSTVPVVLTDDSGSMLSIRADRRGKAIIDSVSGNFMNCSTIYPFNTSGLRASGDWHLYDPTNYGRHYLTDPLNPDSEAKNNKEIDVFLCNDAVRISNLTFQGHGGFSMVLDPEGQIKTKSPYGQVCSSFSQSINRKRFAGGQFVDGFTGRLRGTIIQIEYDGIETFDLTNLTGGSLYTPSSSSVIYANVPLIGLTVTATATTITTNLITLNTTTNLTVGSAITFAGTTFGGISAGVRYYIKTIDAGDNKITISRTQGGEVLELTTSSGTCTATTGGTGATANITVTNGSVSNILIVTPGEYYKQGEFLSALNTNIGGTGSGFQVPVGEVNGQGLQITVQGTVNSGLDIRPPQPPCAFFVEGGRYQINDIVSFNASTATVVLKLDVATPFDAAGAYDNFICSRDVGLILDSVTYDLVIGSNYQTVKAGTSYQRATASEVLSSQLGQTLAGLNFARDSVLGVLTDPASITSVTTSMAVINTIIEQGVTAAPAITYPTVSGLTTSSAEKFKNNLLANKDFITNEVTAYIASTFNLKLFSTYNSRTIAFDIAYMIDAIVYDIMYGGNSMTYDNAQSYFKFQETTVIPGLEAIYVSAIARVVVIGQQIALNSTVTKSTGNTESQVINPAYLILNTDPEYTKFATLCNIVTDYIADGDFDTSTTRTVPVISGLDSTLLAQRTLVQNAKSTIQNNTILYLNDGGGLRINIEMGGNKSMLANDFAMINDLGYAIVCTNGGVSEQVSTFTYYCHTHYWANNGGQIRSVAGSNAHGTFGLRATGFDVTEKPDAVSLTYDMVQVARVYKQGAFASEMTPTANKQALAVYIFGYNYIPTNTTEIEINHALQGGGFTRYEVNSVEHTVVTLGGQNILKLNLSSAGNNGTSSTGLAYALVDGQTIVIRGLQNIKFNEIANVNPTRPSTALQYNDNLADIYRILAYNLNEATGELLPNNVSILQSDASFNYYKFVVDISNTAKLDWDFALDVTGASGNGSTVTITYATQQSAPYTAGERITVQDVVSTGVTTTAYNGIYVVTACTTSQVQFASTVTDTYASGGYVGAKTQGSRVGDQKISVLEISQATTINQINKGTYVVGWHGRTHRVSGYTIPLKIAQSNSVVSWTSGTRTLVVSSVSGIVEIGDIVTGTGISGAVFVESISGPVTVGVTQEYTIVLDTATGVTTPSGTLIYGIARSGYLNIDINPISNILGDGSTIPALAYISKVVPVAGKKFVTYDVAWTPTSLPIADNWYNIAGQTTPGYNYWNQVSNVVSRTQITVADISGTTGLTAGMLVTSITSGAVVPEGTIIQSIDSATTFTVAPACWIPAGASVSSTIVATVASIVITNGGTNYEDAPIITFVGGGATVQALATCKVNSSGQIEEVTLVAPGYGYTSVPTIELSYGDGLLTAVLTASATVNTVAAAGVSTNQITVAYDNDPGTFEINDAAEITATISNGAGATGTTLDVSSVARGKLKVGSTIFGTGITAGTRITALVSGTGGTGTYTVNNTHYLVAVPLTASVVVSSFTSKVGPASFTAGISGTTLTVASVGSGTLAIGQRIRGIGVADDTYITAGSGSSWTVSVSQTVGSGTVMSAGYAVSLAIATQSTAPTALSWYKISSSNNPLYNGLYYAAKTTTSEIVLAYDNNPGTWDSAIVISAFVSKTEVDSVFQVEYTIPTQSQIPAVGSTWTITGNATAAYNGTFNVIEATSTTVTLAYPTDPGSYGAGTTTLNSVVYITIEPVSATSSSLGLSQPFATDTAPTLRLGYPAGARAQITTRISTCRATGHDFLDIGTGSYSTTNYPFQIYGNPTQSRREANEVVENGVGRVFYVTSDQNGIFKVGKFFKVDQGTGTVTFSASIALSNLDGIGFKRGVVVSEFSTDTSMTNNAPEIVPTQSATRGYIDKRLGLDHGGGPVAISELIGPGYLALNGNLTMKGNLNMGTFAITNLATPLITDAGTNAANKTYVDTAVSAFDEFRELRDVQWTNLSAGEIPVYDQSTIFNITGGNGTGAFITVTFVAQATAPFPIGSLITVSGVSPNSYNGTFIVTGCTVNSVTYASVVTSTYISGGTVVANKWRNISLPTDSATSDVLLTYSGVTGKITSAIQSGKIVNSMVGSTAAIAQSKLNMNAATTRANATSIVQANLGLASFKDIEFNSTSGWISLKDAVDSTTGIVYSKLAWQSQSTVLGRAKSAGTGAVGEISFGDVVRDGDGIKNAPFAATGAMSVSYDGTNTLNNSYSVISVTTTGAANSLTRTDSTSNLNINGGYINATSLRINTTRVIDTNTGTNTVQFYTPGQYSFLSSAGTDATNTTVRFSGREIDLITNSVSLRSTTLTTGAATTNGTMTGNWTMSGASNITFSSGTLDVTSGTLKSDTLTTGADTTTGTIQGYWSLTGSSRLEATYADLAEYYEGDREYKSGTVLVFGGEKEVTTTGQMNDTRLAGVVTTNPAYIMNSEQTGIKVCIALAGRVPCWVVGRVKKGDMLTTATTWGCAVKANNPTIGAIIGKALEDKDSGEAGIIQIAVGRA
jgi:hypothetical protein